MALEARVLEYKELETKLRNRVEGWRVATRRHILESLAEMCYLYHDIKAGKKPHIVVGDVVKYADSIRRFSNISPPHPIVQQYPNALLFFQEAYDVINWYVENKGKQESFLARYSKSLEKELGLYDLLANIVNISVLQNIIESMNESNTIPREIRLIKLYRDRDYGDAYVAYKIESGEVPKLQKHTLDTKAYYASLLGRLSTLMLIKKSRPIDIRILYNRDTALFQIYVMPS